MASRDMVSILYNETIKIEYRDSSHQYWARKRENFDLAPGDLKAWGKSFRPKGTTTLIGDTLEKKGLMLWPMGLALRELTGFYDFTNEKGEQMRGFSRGVGTLWETPDQNSVAALSKAEILERFVSASQAHSRRKKKGADIGSVVHEAIEAYINGQPFALSSAYMAQIDNSDYETEADRQQALREFESDIDAANRALDNFVEWWDSDTPELIASEQIVYSLKHNFTGIFDAKVKKGGKLIRMDFKTSNASNSREAAAPWGVYYSHFVQLGMYELAAREMGDTPCDDLMVVSCRKDGGFNVVAASDLGLTVEDCLGWAESVVAAYKAMDRTKKALLKIAEGKEAVYA